MPSQTFTYTGAGQLFVVPAGVSSLTVDIRGGKNGAAQAGRTRGKMNVFPGEVLWIAVGGNGEANSGSTGGAGGWPNGGQGGNGNNGEPGGCGGGGASVIRSDNSAGPVLCAAGGSGGRAGEVQGGAGGGAAGQPGKLNSAGDTGANSAQPGTPFGAGVGGHSGVNSDLDGEDANTGILATAGAGGGPGVAATRAGGGGGGGGYRSGGGGRGSSPGNHPAGGGGGGAGYAAFLLNPTFGTTNPDAPAGRVILSWATPVASVPPNPPSDIEINGVPEEDELATQAVGPISISAEVSRTLSGSPFEVAAGRMLVRLSSDPTFASYTDYWTPSQQMDSTPRRRTIKTASLAANTHYYVRVWAQSYDGLYSLSYNSTNFWTNRSPNPPVLDAPVENANLPSGFDITFEWDSDDTDPDQPGVNPQRGWELQFREQRQITDASGPLLTFSGHTTDESLVVDDSNFKGATFYEWRVRIHDEMGFWSDWSLFNSFYIVSGVKPPLLISPIEDEAVAVDQEVRFRWLFRDPNGDGLDRTDIRYRAVGAEEWTNDFAGGTDTLLYRDYPAGTFTPGFRYEWQARTWDDTITESEWSDSETFWAINTPGAAAQVTPLYVGDQRELGTGVYRIFIYRQGGQEVVGEITHHSLLRFRRIRDDISNCTVVYNGSDAHICELLANIRCWMHEVVVFRNGKRVWEGPITLTTYKANQVEIEAQDVMAYLYRRIMRQGYNDSYRLLTFQDDFSGGVVQVQIGLNTVVERAARIIVNGLAPHDVNLLPYLTRFDYPDDARQSRIVPDYATTCWQEVDDLAANAGLDYTVVGRRIILWDTHRPIGRLPQMSNNDFSEPPIVSEYGMQLANYYAVTNGNGVWGHARPRHEAHENDFYGPVELLTSAYGETEAGNEEVLTQEARVKLIETFEEQAARGIASRWPTPLIVRVPDNSTLNPNVEVGFDQLIPGVWIPLIASGTCRTVEQWQKLDEVTVEVTPQGETVSVTMSPAPNAGQDPDQGGEEDAGEVIGVEGGSGITPGIHEGSEGEVTVVVLSMGAAGQMNAPAVAVNGAVVFAVPMTAYGEMYAHVTAFAEENFTCEDLSDAVFEEIDGSPVGWYNSTSGKIEGLPPFAAAVFSFPDLDAVLDGDSTFDFKVSIPITAPFTVSYKDGGTTTVLKTITTGAPNPVRFSLTPSDLGVVAANPGGSLLFQATGYNKVSEFCWNKITDGEEEECVIFIFDDLGSLGDEINL